MVVTNLYLVSCTYLLGFCDRIRFGFCHVVEFFEGGILCESGVCNNGVVVGFLGNVCIQIGRMITFLFRLQFTDLRRAITQRASVENLIKTKIGSS